MVVPAENGRKARTIKTKIKLISHDNSMLDTSQLDTSRNESYMEGDVIDLKKRFASPQ